MKNDDHQVGRSLSRREVLALVGGVAAATLTGCSGSNLVFSPGSPSPTPSTTPSPTSPPTSTPTASPTTTPEASATGTASATPTPSVTPTPASLSCVVTPAETEGPYFVDEM